MVRTIANASPSVVSIVVEESATGNGVGNVQIAVGGDKHVPSTRLSNIAASWERALRYGGGIEQLDVLSRVDHHNGVRRCQHQVRNWKV